MNFIYDWQLIKANRDFSFLYDTCITFYAIYDEITGAAHG